MDTKEFTAENPFEPTEIQYAFDCQEKKLPFEIVKEAKTFNGQNATYSLKGRSIPNNYYEIWEDDYIVHFSCVYGNSGSGYAKNRFDTIEKFKEEILSAFNLVEKIQLSLF